MIHSSRIIRTQNPQNLIATGVKSVIQSRQSHHKNEKLYNSLVDIISSKSKSSSKNQKILYSGVRDKNSLGGYIPLKKYCDPVEGLPRLQHDLDRVVFSPGIHHSQDPRTRHVNFSQEVLDLPPVNEFKFDKIAKFVPSSKDAKMVKICEEVSGSPDTDGKLEYFSSTSSLTGVLTHFHKLLSYNRPIFTKGLSNYYSPKSHLSYGSSVASTVVLSQKAENVYSLDKEKASDSELVLQYMGHLLECFLSTPPEEFRKYLKSNPEDPSVSSTNMYHYAKAGKFLLRSQLDAYHPELPGTGVFDLKTRAVVAIRRDIQHTDLHPTNYEIHRTVGTLESFEFELYDLIRIVMFKYALQARLGNMDGIFVAYHNIKKCLGFQYLPLSTIDHLFFGPVDDYKETAVEDIVDDIGSHWQNKREELSTYMANFEFETSLTMWEKLLDTVRSKTRGKPCRLIVVYQEPTDYCNEPHIACFANVVSKETLDRLELVAEEKFENEKEQIILQQEQERKDYDNNGKNEDELITDRVLRIRKKSGELKRYVRELNSTVYKESENEGAFMFVMKADHFLNKNKMELGKNKYPTPPIEILDPKSNVNWRVKYTISQITDPMVARDEYFYHCYELLRLNFGSDGESDKDELTRFQKILRAYSIKSIKRNEMFESMKSELLSKHESTEK